MVLGPDGQGGASAPLDLLLRDTCSEGCTQAEEAGGQSHWRTCGLAAGTRRTAYPADTPPPPCPHPSPFLSPPSHRFLSLLPVLLPPFDATFAHSSAPVRRPVRPSAPQGPLYLINGKYLKAGLAFRSSLLSFEALQAAGGDPHPVVASYRDWGIGIFQLFLANAPQSILSVLELVAGIKGDMVEARRKLQACVDGAGPAARWAAVVLAMDKVNSAACGFDPAVAMASLESARAVIDEQLRLLPGSALLKWMHAVVVLRMGDLPRALIAMDEVQAQVVPALASRGVPAYRLALEVGLIHFACRDLDTAIACWEPLADPVRGHPPFPLVSLTAVSLTPSVERARRLVGRSWAGRVLFVLCSSSFRQRRDSQRLCTTSPRLLSSFVFSSSRSRNNRRPRTRRGRSRLCSWARRSQ